MLSEPQGDTQYWASKMRKIVFFQIVLSGFAAVVVVMFFGSSFGASFFAGCLLVCFNAWLMSNTFSSEGVGQKAIYRSAVFRYVGVFLVLFLLAVMGVNLLAVCAGMFVVYLAGYVFSVRAALDR